MKAVPRQGISRSYILDINVKLNYFLHMVVPPFTAGGLLPIGDYTLTFDELLHSTLARGIGGNENWNAAWRAKLVEGLKVLAGHLASFESEA